MTCFGCFRTFILPFFWAFTFANAQQWITTASPARNATGVISFTPIILTGTEALNTATVIPANIRVNGSYSGPISLSQVSYNSGANSITIVPSSSYAAGEKITVSLTPAVTTSAGAPISGIIQFHAVVRTAKDNFSDSVTVLIKDNTGGVSSADVNKDGYLDLIVNDLKGFITVYINNKNKTFRAAQTFGDELFGWSAGKNVSADFDGDADIDILLPIKWGRFQLFTNNGGTFTKQEYFLSMGSLNAENMVTAELADLNSDGLIDVASPNGNSMVNTSLDWSSATILSLNNGNGTFTKKAIQSGGGGYGAIASGDIDNDGDLDLAVTNVHNGAPFTISILKNNGSGTFTKTGSVIANSGSRALTLADMDKDGDLDIAFTTYTQEAVIAVYSNLGNGEFSASGTVTPVAMEPSALHTCDLNGDGTMDLIAANIYANEISLLHQNTPSSFTLTVMPTANAPKVIHPADYDNDGDPDIAVLCENGVQIFWNESIRIEPTFAHFGVLPWNTIDTASFTLYNYDPSKQATILSAVLKRTGFVVDGLPATIPSHDSSKFRVIFSPVTPSLYRDTLVLTVANSETLIIALPLQGSAQPIAAVQPLPYSIHADTNHSPVITTPFPFSSIGLAPHAVAVHGSFTGLHSGTILPYDPINQQLTFDPDKPFSPGERVRISVTSRLKDAAGDSLGTPLLWEFETGVTDGSGKFSRPSNANNGWSSITLPGDFNGDGSIDLVNIANANCYLFLNDGKGNLHYTSTSPFETGGGYGAIGDIDHNGTLDILISQGYWQSVQWLKNNGNGTFTAQPKISISPYSALQMSLADMNNDGFVDIVAVNDYSMILVSLNNHHGSFDKTYNFRSGRYTNRMCLADLDGDGDLDVTASAEGELYFHKNDGNGILSIVKVDTITFSVSHLVTADVNNDRRPDIIAGQGNTFGTSFFVLYNTGNCTFTKTFFGTTGKGTSDIETGDFDSDGDIDLAVKNVTSSTLDFYTNSGGDFSGIVSTVQGLGGSDCIAAEMTGDGAVDIALTPANPLLPNAILHNRRRTPSISISPSAINFGASVINTTVFKTLRIYNQGTESTLHVSFRGVDTPGFDVAPDSVTIEPYDSVDVIVTFLPTQGIAYRDTLSITTNDPVNPVISITLLGSGVGKPVSPAQLFPADSSHYVPVPVTLQWKNDSTVEYFHVQVFKGSLAGPLVVEIPSSIIPSVTVNTLELSTMYVWRVAGVNIAGKSPFSPPQSFTTVKSGPVNLILTMKDFQSATASWNTLADPMNQRYYLYAGVRPDSLIRIDSADAAVSTVTLSGIPTGVPYYYGVTGTDTSGHETARSALVRYAIPYFSIGQLIGDQNQTPMDAAWGDIDNDNDLDLIFTGYFSGPRKTVLYRNQNDTLVEAWSINRGIYNNAVEWGDFDGDGDIDLLHGNYNDDKAPYGSFTEIYLNNGPGAGSSWNFTKLDMFLMGEYPGWIDYDNDGDLDVMVGSRSAIIYQNNGPAENNRWKFSSQDMTYLYLIWRAFGDYDNNGTTDIADLGLTTDFRVLKNFGSAVFQPAFTDPGYGYSQGGEVLWADMNNDGLLDICANGGNNPSAKTRIYFNSGSTGGSPLFTRTLFPNSTYESGKILAGDFDNDGWNDLFYSGKEKTAMLRNLHSGQFGTIVSGVDTSSSKTVYVAGDYTNDGRLDLAMMTYSSPIMVLRNVLPPIANTLQPPDGLSTTFSGDTVLLHWNILSDSSSAVTYNVYLHPVGAKYIVSPNADTVTGYRRIAVNGNAGTASLFRTRLQKSGTYRWSVQSVSGAYLGSPFAAADTFTIQPLSVDRSSSVLPTHYALDQNYPNPFNPATLISYALPQQANVTLEIFTVLGQSVYSIPLKQMPAGFHQEVWNAGGHSSGVYFYRVTVRDPLTGELRFTQTKKMMLIR